MVDQLRLMFLGLFGRSFRRQTRRRKQQRWNYLRKQINRFINTEDTKVIDGISPFDFEISILRKIWLELDSPTFPPFQFGNISETSFGFCSVSSKYQRMIAHVKVSTLITLRLKGVKMLSFIDGFLQVWLVLYTSKALQLLSTKGEVLWNFLLSHYICAYISSQK